MLKVSVKKVPEYLKNSDYYSTLDLEDTLKFKVPYMKNDDSVNSLEDLDNYLKTAEYWMLNLEIYMPKHIKKFINKNLSETIPIILKYKTFENMKNIFYYYLDLDFENLENDGTIKVQYGNNWNFVINSTLLFQNDKNNNFFKKVYEKIENNEIFEEKFESIIESDYPQLKFKHYKISYDNDTLSFLITSSFGKTLQKQSKEKIESSYNIQINFLNKKKIIKSFKKAHDTFNEICEKY